MRSMLCQLDDLCADFRVTRTVGLHTGSFMLGIVDNHCSIVLSDSLSCSVLLLEHRDLLTLKKEHLQDLSCLAVLLGVRNTAYLTQMD
jgi:hypothetical protein